MIPSLFGDDFNINLSNKKKINVTKKTNIKDLVNRISTKKDVLSEAELDKILKSKAISLEDRLFIIKTRVLRVLGKQKDNVMVIRDRETLFQYIDKAIACGKIAIDTETNNSLDPVTCKLMGLCLYVPGEKQVYIPVNHRDPKTKIRLPWQLTEADCRDALVRMLLLRPDIEIIMHNGKFDYEVLKCTCGIEIKPTWDTLIGQRLLNENEPAGLKWIYTSKIDKSQEKYDLEKLFRGVAYADVDPYIFALYAATDSFMTYKVYEIQVPEFEKPEYGPHLDLTGKHTVKGLRWVFHNVEMPIVIVTAEMELRGVAVDEKYGARLKAKYDKQLDDATAEINQILESLKPIINKWLASDEASQPQKIYMSKKSKMSEEKKLATYPYEDEIGRYKIGKKASKDILDNPINLDSSTQVAILFYDILKVPNKATDGSKKTGKDELKTIKETLADYLPKLEEIQTEFDEEELEYIDDVEEALEMSADQEEIFRYGNAAKLAAAILKRRGITKLVTTYIDVIPQLVKHWPDHRIRFHLNSLGTDTGRYSSGGKLKFMENDEAIEVSGINIQNIPSHNPEVRMLFTAKETYGQQDITDNDELCIPEITQVETTSGYKYCADLKSQDKLISTDGEILVITNIIYDQINKQYNIQVK